MRSLSPTERKDSLRPTTAHECPRCNKYVKWAKALCFGCAAEDPGVGGMSWDNWVKATSRARVLSANRMRWG